MNKFPCCFHCPPTCAGVGHDSPCPMGGACPTAIGGALVDKRYTTSIVKEAFGDRYLLTCSKEPGLNYVADQPIEGFATWLEAANAALNHFAIYHITEA